MPGDMAVGVPGMLPIIPKVIAPGVEDRAPWVGGGDIVAADLFGARAGDACAEEKDGEAVLRLPQDIDCCWFAERLEGSGV